MESGTGLSWTRSTVDFIPGVTQADVINYTSHVLDNDGNTPFPPDFVSSLPPWAGEAKPILEIMMLITVTTLMLAMGCEVQWEHIVSHMKRPVSLSIGMTTQFLFLPLFTFIILSVADVKGIHAAGILIVSCCPGGVLSNSFTYLCEGDLSLSLAMTFVSTINAMVMLPANTWLFGRQFETGDLVIPYAKMALSTVVVTCPVLVGILIKWKFPKVASRTAKIGVYGGLLLMTIYVITQLVIIHGKFAEIPAKVHVIVLFMPIIGFGIGYVLSILTKQTLAIRKTIGIETGVQNLPLAATIMSLSFPRSMQEEMLVIPFTYAATMIGGAILYCVACHFYKKYSREDVKYEEAAQLPPKIEDVEYGFGNGTIYEHNNVQVVTTNGKEIVKFSSSNGTTDPHPEIDSELPLKQ